VKRSPGNEKDDTSFKTLLARLDDAFDPATPYDSEMLAALPNRTSSASIKGSQRHRRFLWAGIAGGMTALGLAGLLSQLLGATPSTARATPNARFNIPNQDLTASLVPIQPAQPVVLPVVHEVAAPIAPARTVRTQAIPVQAATSNKAEPDGPPVPLVTPPSRPLDRAPQTIVPTQSLPADVKLLVAPSQRARAGASTPIAIKVEVGGQPSDRLRVALSGFNQGVAFSAGEPRAAGVWHVPVPGIEQLQLRLPTSVSEDMTIALELQDGDGNSLARATTHIIVLPAPPPPPKPAPPVATAPAPQPPASPPPAAMVATPVVPAPLLQSHAPAAPPRLSMDEDTAMIERGRLLARNGDIAGARLLFERAADVGSGRAALLLGETYDPDVLASMGVLGAKGDLGKARRWYARATELGIPIAAERLKALAGK
jgi:hypothetical protein